MTALEAVEKYRSVLVSECSAMWFKAGSPWFVTVEDLMQEVVIRILSEWPKISNRDEEYIPPIMRLSARRCCQRIIRRSRGQSVDTGLEEDTLHAARSTTRRSGRGDAPDGSTMTILRDIAQCLVIRGMTVDQTAKELGLTSMRVRVLTAQERYRSVADAVLVEE